jgi:hypothetical protein
LGVRALAATLLIWAAFPLSIPPVLGAPTRRAAGATLTVLRGTAAVLQVGGTPLSPASSG